MTITHRRGESRARRRSGEGLCGVLVTLATAALLTGCSRSSATAAADAGAPSAAPIASASASPATPASSGLAPSQYGLVLADRLNQEAARRPTGTPKAEDVLAAIAKSGVPLADQAQHLGSPVGARYCVGAKSTDDVAMSACEYADEAAAAAGKDQSTKAFASVEHRDVVVNKKTTLTILQSPFDAKSQAAHDKAIAAFKTL